MWSWISNKIRYVFLSVKLFNDKFSALDVFILIISLITLILPKRQNGNKTNEHMYISQPFGTVVMTFLYDIKC